jgi:tetratricopeptide (TPR) repeat protein
MSERKAVRMWEEKVQIPTYGIGEPDYNPIFLEKRVYQGSSGKVYPYPVIDKIKDEKEVKTYQMIFLENQYLQIQIMPEIGGRVYRALDKTNNCDFVYYNRVIKPALVGLAGPWISGGIEFNWPQHHRPNTFGPVEYQCVENKDGSKTVWVSEIDRMYGTKGMAGFTLYPDKAYLEISGQLYNRTPLPQTFLWWANPAVSVHNETQSVFPPDVHAVFDHGKRDVSRFPIATGTYYKMDYSSGVDISRYKNIPVPTSYMAYHSDYNFIGGYDHREKAGILHVANHHISPGKKQWTWGCGEFGKAWDCNLTDEDGPYIELMTGVYTDNQPDFSWLQPYEEKSFKQYFMPYKQLGVVKNATIDAAVHLEAEEGVARVIVYVTALHEHAYVELNGPEGRLWLWQGKLSPVDVLDENVELPTSFKPQQLKLTVKNSDGRILVSYRPEPEKIEKMPEAAKAIEAPEKLANTEALFLAGQHLEQYRHATYKPDTYYLEGLKRDPGDVRLNNAFGMLLLRKGCFADSEPYFRRAVETLIRHNPNPYNCEPFYHLGLSLKYQAKLDEAYHAFYKSIWSSAWQDSGYFSIAQIDCAKGDYDIGLEHIERSIMRNYRSLRARNLKTALLRRSGRLVEAEAHANGTKAIDIADFGCRNELVLLHRANGQEVQAKKAEQELNQLMRREAYNYMALTEEYCGAGLYAEASGLLQRAVEAGMKHPIIYYALAFVLLREGKADKADQQRKQAEALSRNHCFPTTLFELQVLEDAISVNPRDAAAHYYLGNLLYDKKRHADAVEHWEKSALLAPGYPTVHRNLALAYYNKLGDANRACFSLEKALQVNPCDARVLFELDQLYKKIGREPSERLVFLEKHYSLVEQRDDLFIEYIALINMMERYEEALKKILARKFHPWEGGEGKVTSQYVLSHIEIAKQNLGEGKAQEALNLLKAATVYPESIGEGKLAGAQENNIYYYMGRAWKQLGDTRKAEECFQYASQGLEEPANAMFYNDQPPEMIFYQGLAWDELGDKDQANSRFNKLVNYGETHLFKELKIDYFAVSLPDFLVFDEDLNKKNEVHCRFMMALGYLGLGQSEKAAREFKQVLKLEPAHQGAMLHQCLVNKNNL